MPGARNSLQYQGLTRIFVLGCLFWFFAGPHQAIAQTKQSLEAPEWLVDSVYAWENMGTAPDVNVAIPMLQSMLDSMISRYDKRQLGLLYMMLGDNYQMRGDLQESIDAFRQALPGLYFQEDTMHLAHVHNLIGISYNELGMNDLSMDHYLKGIQCYEGVGDYEGSAMIYANIGALFDSMAQDSLALVHYRKSLQILSGLDQPSYYRADIYVNIGEYHRKANDLDSAMYYYQRAQNVYELYGPDELSLGNVELNMADAMNQERNYPAARQHAYKALAWYTGLQDSLGLAYTWLTLSYNMANTNQPQRAETYLKLAENVALKYQNVELLNLTLAELRRQAEGRGDFEMALFYADSLDRQRIRTEAKSDNMALHTMRMIFQTDQKDLEIKQLQLERERDLEISRRKDYSRFALLVLVGVAFIFTLFLININRNRKLVNDRLNEQRLDLIEKNNRIVAQQNELRELNTRLMKEKRLAEEANESKDLFLSVVSHELRTPLNAVVGFSRLLKDGKHLPSQTESLQGLESSAQVLLSLINNLLDLKKLSSGNYQFESRAFDPQAVIRETLDILAATSRKRAVELKFDFESNGIDYLRGDIHALRQVLLNICGNALKFTRQGSVEVNVMLNREVHPSGQPHAKMQLKIVDTGIGIPKDKLPFIFEKFHQADSSIKRSYGGSGLGLSITKNLVEQQGGTIDIKSQEGLGTEVTVALTYRVETKAQEIETFSDEEISEEEVSILIAEDNDINVRVLLRFLERWGYEADVATNGVEAVQRSTERAYDLILLDIQMPEMDGFEAAYQIRQIQPEVVIVALTANPDPEIFENMQARGVDDFLSKPFDPIVLKRLIDRALKKRLARLN